ncbi:MAG TPA: tetratricopeptide repeat protein, partial [Chloroflexota bacterium]|nr:tetratricopeptide repeat protein [Chloroflexota bacterium]
TRPDLLRAQVVSYNRITGDGAARLRDHRGVVLTHGQLTNPALDLLPGDIIEFLPVMKKQNLEAHEIRLVASSIPRPANGSMPPLREVDRQQADRLPPRLSAIRSPTSTPMPSAPPARANVAKTPSRQRNDDAQILYSRAARAKLEDRIEDARRYFWQAIEAGAPPQTYEAFIKMESERGGSRQEVRRIVDLALKHYPQHANIYDAYGRMELRARRYDSAQSIFRQGLERNPAHPNLLWGLAQTLIQTGGEASFREASEIFDKLESMGRLPKDHGLYQRFKALQRNDRANRAYDFLVGAGFRVGIAGQRGTAGNYTDIVVEMKTSEFNDSFGLTGAFLVRCFQRTPAHIDVLNLSTFLRGLSRQGVIGLQDGRGEVVLNRTLAFIAVPDADAVRDQVMNILSEGYEAIVPLDDEMFQLDDSLQILRDSLGQYLGQRDLYMSTLPISGVRRFFGRETLLRTLADQIHGGQFIGIYGLRKMGKTSLVYKLRDETLEDEAVAYVDLLQSPVLQTKDCNALYWEVERKLYERLSQREPDLASLLRLGKVERFTDVPGGTPAGLIFAENLKTLLERVREGVTAIKRVVIVLDELEKILPIGQTRIDGYIEFFGLLRGLGQDERYSGVLSCVVVAANAAISERGYWEGRENPVFALFRPEFLPPFSLDECMEMIRTLGKGMSVYWDDPSIEAIYDETGGHPFLTRLLCSKIARHNPARPLRVNRDLVTQQIVPFLRDEGDKIDQITELLHTNFPEEERILEQIALDQAPSSIPDDALRHLQHYHLVAIDPAPRITLNLLRRWLRRRAGVIE